MLYIYKPVQDIQEKIRLRKHCEGPSGTLLQVKTYSPIYTTLTYISEMLSHTLLKCCSTQSGCSTGSFSYSHAFLH